MLIRFHFENFLSFKSETEFSMVAGRSNQHPEHVVDSLNSFTPAILRTAAIYGKNASGKSNFIKALDFAKELVTNPPSTKRSLSVRKFRLDSAFLKKPSGFRFELMIKGKMYDYGFILNDNLIEEEWLYEIKRTTETQLFHRKKKTLKLGKIDYSQTINSKNPTNELIKDQKKRLFYVGEDTRDNQLFLNATIERTHPYFKDIYNWFDNNLFIIRPDSKYLDTEFQIIEGDENDDFIKGFEEILKQFDTGIEGIELVEVDVEKEIIRAYPYLKDLHEVLDNLEPGAKAMLPMPDDIRFALVKNENGILSAKKLMTKHKKKVDKTGELFEIKNHYELFELNWESQGTQRLMDLIPSLLVMKNSSSTFVIDEIGRSLHPELIRKFIKLVLENRNLFKSQLIFTTHSDYLMDLELLRRDEVWFTKKDDEGKSSMYSLEEFKPRYDKDIRRGYLDGRFGGVPLINEEGINQVLSK